jgi:hypothetical protein|tara:strand:+ start:346 stop:555 length:210 start_codon:yes stop_codon:yes gene_type:complete
MKIKYISVDPYYLTQVVRAAQAGLTEMFDELKLYNSESSEDRDKRTHIYASIGRLNVAIEEIEKKILFS